MDLTKTDLTKIAVGSFAQLGGTPADHARSVILSRAGVPMLLNGQPHPLRVDLVHTHASAAGDGIVRLPSVFPPADYTGPLLSAQDYLDAVDASCLSPAPIIISPVSLSPVIPPLVTEAPLVTETPPV